MKKKLVLKGILAVVLVFTIVLTGCKKKETAEEVKEVKEEAPKQNTITITGLPGEFSFHATELGIFVFLSFADFNDEILDAIGGIDRDDIEDGTVTVSLIDTDEKPWTKKGSYLVAFYSESYYGDGVSQTAMYVYTGGKTLRELGIRSKNEKADYFDSKLPKINFNGEEITLSFDDFADMSDIIVLK
jgi:hypothetical protein